MLLCMCIMEWTGAVWKIICIPVTAVRARRLLLLFIFCILADSAAAPVPRHACIVNASLCVHGRPESERKRSIWVR